MKRWILFLVALAISAIFLYFGFQGLEPGEILDVMGGAAIGWVLPGVVVYFVAVAARTWRWHYLLRPLKAVPLRDLFPIVVIGYMGNNVYPFRAGEVIRSYLLKRKHNVSIAAGLTTIVIERLFDGLTMLLFVFAALPFAPLGADWLRTTVIFASAAFFGALIVFLFLAARPELARRLYYGIAERILPERVRAPLLGFADRLMDGLSSLRSPRDLAMILFSSVAVWLPETMMYWFIMRALGDRWGDAQITFFVLMLVTAMANLATIIPSSPGNVGTFDTPAIRTLEAFGADRALAAGYTLILHAALWLPVTALGFVYLAREGLGWADFQRAEEAVEEASEDVAEETPIA
jgi:hypothetical protein